VSKAGGATSTDHSKSGLGVHLRLPLAQASAGITVGSKGLGATVEVAAPVASVQAEVAPGLSPVEAATHVSIPLLHPKLQLGADKPVQEIGLVVPVLLAGSPQALVDEVVLAGSAGSAESMLRRAAGSVLELRSPAPGVAVAPAVFDGTMRLSVGPLSRAAPTRGGAAVSAVTPVSQAAVESRAGPVSRGNGSPSPPPKSPVPFGLSSGTGAGIGFAAALFAALSVFFVLVAPRSGRWLRPVVGLARPPAFASLIERPG
jgi:hypothetical protein